MGADLISFIVTGPQEITEDMIEKAAEALFKDYEKKKATGKAWCANCEEEFNFDDGDGECGTCGEGVARFDSLAAAKHHITSLVKDWPDLGRDCAFRDNPDKPDRLIVIGGEMSWGEEPEGSGYQTLKLLMCGLPKAARQTLKIK